MLHKYFKILLLLILLVYPVVSRLNIVTSIPDLADIAKQIGRDSVSVFSLATGTENYHMIQARSSFLPKLNRADLVICLGLEAEDRWLVPIVNAARNKNIKKGSSGWIEAYKGLKILELPANPETIIHEGGHRLGNPHINSGPYCGKVMAKNIYEAFITFDAGNKKLYESRYTNYIGELDKMESSLLQKAAPLKNVHVICYHADLAYFAHFYGMTVTGCLEPQPGVQPNSKHLAKLVARANNDHVRLMLYHQAQDPRLPEKIAARIGAQPVCFANMVRARENITTFIALQEFNLDIMLKALLKTEEQ